MLIILKAYDIFGSNIAYIFMATSSSYWYAEQLPLMDEELLSISPVGCGQLVQMLITLEPHGILGSKCACLFILALSSDWYANW